MSKTTKDAVMIVATFVVFSVGFVIAYYMPDAATPEETFRKSVEWFLGIVLGGELVAWFLIETIDTLWPKAPTMVSRQPPLKPFHISRSGR